MALTETWSDIPTTIGTDGFVASTVAQSAKMNEGVLQNLMWLKKRPFATEQDFDGTFFSTTSSAFQDTGANAALTTTGGRVAVVCFGSVDQGSAANTQAILTLYEDGVNKGDATFGMQYVNMYSVANSVVPFCMFYVTPTAPAAGAHEWKLYLRNGNNVNSVSIKTQYIAAFEVGV